MTKSCPSAAVLGVGAEFPPYCLTHCSAFAAVRLYTVTSCPPLFFKCPAMGYPITPRPRNATFAIVDLLQEFPASLGRMPPMPICQYVIAGASASTGLSAEH